MLVGALRLLDIVPNGSAHTPTMNYSARKPEGRALIVRDRSDQLQQDQVQPQALPTLMTPRRLTCQQSLALGQSKPIATGPSHNLPLQIYPAQPRRDMTKCLSGYLYSWLLQLGSNCNIMSNSIVLSC